VLDCSGIRVGLEGSTPPQSGLRRTESVPRGALHKPAGDALGNKQPLQILGFSTFSEHIRHRLHLSGGEVRERPNRTHC
jgi:hypothetical protein